MKVGRDHDHRDSSRLRNALGKWLSFCALVAFFLATSSIFIPDRSRGARSMTGGVNSSSTRSGVAGDESIDLRELPVIGELVCKSHRIRILAAMPEPLYTILDADGEVVASRLTASAVALRFPDIPLLSPLGRIDVDSFSDSEDATARDEELPLMSDVPTDSK